MNQKTISELKEKLEREKTAVEEQLKTFADKDPNLKGDWDSKFPKFNGEFGGAALETAADEVEEYGARLPVEHSLELRLRDINISLEKINDGKSRPCRGSSMKSGYGKCENCKKDIDEKRLMVNPAARSCVKCSPR